jgi:hypothetical protein
MYIKSNHMEDVIDENWTRVNALNGSTGVYGRFRAPPSACRRDIATSIIRTNEGAIMTEAGSVTAALLVIGDEILSGRTKDQNFGYVADYLTCWDRSARGAGDPG